MKLPEAMIEARDNGSILKGNSDDGPVLMRIIDDNIQFKLITENKWRQAGGPSFSFGINAEWEIYEEPKSQISYITMLIHGNLNEQYEGYGFKNAKIPAKNEKERKSWHDAFDTFFELKSHPLIDKIDDSRQQWFIDMHEERIHASYEKFSYKKMTQISPSFNAYSHAEQVINDIGQARLLHMFRTFQGIYE